MNMIHSVVSVTKDIFIAMVLSLMDDLKMTYNTFLDDPHGAPRFADRWPELTWKLLKMAKGMNDMWRVISELLVTATGLVVVNAAMAAIICIQAQTTGEVEGSIVAALAAFVPAFSYFYVLIPVAQVTDMCNNALSRAVSKLSTVPWPAGIEGQLLLYCRTLESCRLGVRLPVSDKCLRAP